MPVPMSPRAWHGPQTPQIAYGWREERANKKMNDEAALLVPRPSRPGATNMGEPSLTAILFRQPRQPSNQTICHLKSGVSRGSPWGFP